MFNIRIWISGGEVGETDRKEDYAENHYYKSNQFSLLLVIHIWEFILFVIKCQYMSLLKNKSFLSRLTDLLSDYFAKPDNSPSGKLYLQAVLSLGRDISPKDEAPDELGCVDSVEEVYKAAFGEYIGKTKTLSTKVLYQTLLFSSKFRKVNEPEKGCIIISPTGSSVLANAIGHVGIVGNCVFVMSNDSRSGLWLEGYSVRSWNIYFGTVKKFPVYYFKKVEVDNLGSANKTMYSLTQGGNLIALSGLISKIVNLIFGIDIIPSEIEALLIAIGIVVSWIGRFRIGDISLAGFRK